MIVFHAGDAQRVVIVLAMFTVRADRSIALSQGQLKSNFAKIRFFRGVIESILPNKSTVMDVPSIAIVDIVSVLRIFNDGRTRSQELISGNSTG